MAAAARIACAATGLSEAQQLSYWARLGKQMEESRTFDRDAVALALAGRAAYDDLGELEQVAVRVTWEMSIRQGADELDYEADFVAKGATWVEADPQGSVVIRNASEEAGGG